MAALLLLLAVPLAAPTTGQAPPTAGCPAGLEARGNGDGTVTLEWSPVPGATHYRIQRAKGDETALVDHARVDAPATSFRDADTSPGVTYRYAVASDLAVAQGASCGAVQATAVPYREGLLTALLITAVGAAGYALVAGTRRNPTRR